MVSKSRILANLGKAVDSATTGHFLAKGTDSNGIFETILYTDLVGTPTTLDSALTSQLIDSSYVQLRQTTSGGGIDSAAVTTLIDSSYVAARSSSGSSGFVRYEYDTTASQTTFQDSDKTGQVLSYTEDYILVHYNGILMADTDYTATSGSSVVFSSGVDSGGIVSITKFSAPSSGGGGGGASFTCVGDRAIVPPGYDDNVNRKIEIDYFDITTTGNASDFGDLSASTSTYHVSCLSNGSRGVFGGGNNRTSTMDYITISTTGNATDYGDLATNGSNLGGISHATRGVWGGIDPRGNTIQYITIANTGNATDFGDLTVARYGNGCGMDATYGVWGGGSDGDAAGSNAIDYVTIMTAGNASDFGDCTGKKQYVAGASSSTRTLFAGGYGGDGSQSRYNVIEYITTATPGNATDFGDLTETRQGMGGTSNGTRAVFAGGDNASAGGGNYAINSIDYVTISTPGNGTDFGDLQYDRFSNSACSGSPS